MNIEQIVKETVAKVVAEKKGKDLNGDGKIDSKDYLQARSNAIEKAKMKNEDHSEDHEVKMAHNSLESIIRSALELKAKIGNQEINIPAWIQDHITNSENYIDQASQGYYKYENNGHESDEIDELQEISDDELAQLQAAADDTSKMPAERDAARNKIYASRAKKESQTLDEAFVPKSSFDDYKIGDNVTVKGKKAKITNMEMDDETGERRARVRFEDGSVEKVSINSLDEAQDISDDELAQLQAAADDTSKMPAERDAARNKIYASRAKKESQTLDEITIRRWQHYAGIK